MIRTFGSSRWAARHSVATSASGWAYCFAAMVESMKKEKAAPSSGRTIDPLGCGSAKRYGASLVSGRQWVWEHAQAQQRAFIASRQQAIAHARARMTDWAEMEATRIEDTGIT